MSAAEQIVAFLPQLPAADPLPWVLFDAGDDPVQLTQTLGETPAAILVRLRAGRCFYADPTSPGPADHVTRATRSPVTTQQPGPPPPANSLWKMSSTARCACTGVEGWHPKTQGEHTQRKAQGRRPIVRGTLLLVEVARLLGRTRQPQALWLWWHTPADPDSIPELDRAWRTYVRRLDLEPTFRLLKQTLNWALPRMRHPEQADRWTWLVALAYTQLRLARPLAGDQPLPWQRPQAAGKLTSERVRRGFSTLLVRRLILAFPPTPCGRSLGRPNGKSSGRATRYPAITKASLHASHAA